VVTEFVERTTSALRWRCRCPGPGLTSEGKSRLMAEATVLHQVRPAGGLPSSARTGEVEE
jgi:hypothetical protein